MGFHIIIWIDIIVILSGNVRFQTVKKSKDNTIYYKFIIICLATLIITKVERAKWPTSSFSSLIFRIFVGRKSRNVLIAKSIDKLAPNIVYTHEVPWTGQQDWICHLIDVDSLSELDLSIYLVLGCMLWYLLIHYYDNLDWINHVNS